MRMKFFLTGFIFVVICFNVAGQNTFQKVFFNVGTIDAIQGNTDGSIVLSGIAYSLPTRSFLIKLDQFGDTIWTRTYIDSVQNLSTSLSKTFDNGYVFTGNLVSTNSYILKTDSTGNPLWAKEIGSSSPDLQIQAVIQLSDSGILIAGDFINTYSLSQDIFLIKMNSIGDTLWTKCYGGNSFDYGRSIVQTLDGGFVIAGYSRSFGSDSFEDYYLIRTDELGNVIWSEVYEDNVSFGYGNSVATTQK